MSDSSSIGFWIRRQFEEVPWTAWLVLINLAVWFLDFFDYRQPAQILAGELSLREAWHWLSYPLFTPNTALGLVLTLFVFYWIAASLERRFGSEKFGRIFVVVTLAIHTLVWIGSAVAQQTPAPQVSLAGLHWAVGTLLCIWAALNAEATILAFFIIPVKAKYFALLSIVGALFSAPMPIGLFLALAPTAAWFWARKQLTGNSPSFSLSQKLKERKEKARKSQFKVLPGKALEGGSASESRASLRSVERAEEAKKRSAEQAELDRILDKIRFDGMASLSAKEKETLDAHSRKLNDGNS